MSQKAQGVLKVKNEENRVSDRFKKREFVLTIEPSSQYPQHVMFQLAQDKCSLLDSHNVGDEIEISFNLRGREFVKDGETRYFNTLDVWQIKSLNKSVSPTQMGSDFKPANNSNESGIFSNPGTDDFPF